MNNKEKRSAVEDALSLPELNAISHREIAKTLGVSNTFVNRVHKGMTMKEKSNREWWSGIGVECRNVRMVHVTPALAQEWFSTRNPSDNRKYSNVVADRLASDISAKLWDMNWEPIIFNWDGMLNDGQHRLSAIIKAGITVDCLVVFDADPETRLTLDTGRRRSSADQLHMAGHDSATCLSAAARLLRGYLDDRVASSRGYTDRVIARTVEEHPGLIDYVRTVHVADKLCSPSAYVCGRYLTSRIDESLSDRFWTQTLTGEMLKKGEPTYALRERYSHHYVRRDRPTAWVFLYEAVIAWNTFRAGKTIVRLPSPSSASQFPRFE